MITITIPGEPVAQGRGRAVGFRRHDGTISARIFDPGKSRNWKATAQAHMRDAVAAPFRDPVRVHVTAIFTCPRSEWRTRAPRPRRWHAKRPDGDNVLKAVKDAANGVLWCDDAQVVIATVKKLIGAQGEAPRVVVRVLPFLPVDPDSLCADAIEEVTP